MSDVLPVPQTLHGNPKSKPQFSVEVQTSLGSVANTLTLADPKATRALVALMDMNAVLGGAACHYGGPAAFAEILSASFALMFDEAEKKNQKWSDLFNFVNDAGHCENGIYALKANYGVAGLSLDSLKGFRSITSPLTGHGESHLFPEGVLMSNGPLGSAFPQSQGLAMADRMSGRERLTLTAISDGACMEGEAREAMAAIPGLAAKGLLNPYVLIISDNNTKLSGRIDQESFSMEPTFKSLTTLGWKVLDLKEGNNLQACVNTVSQALQVARSNPKQPVAIHAKTLKGIGTKKTAESSSGGHGFPLKSPTELPAFLTEIYDGEKYPPIFDSWISDLISLENQMKAQAAAAGPKPKDEKIQAGVSAAMIEAKKKGLPIVSITSDLPGSTGVAGFRKEFPQSSLDVGVAESNMISVAAGFSKMGFIPVVDTFAQFGVTKGALPLTMAALSQSPMICIFSHTGFQDAADGASHQALSYVAMLSSIPHVRVVALTCSEDARALVAEAIEKFAADRKAGREPESTVFFLGRENFPLSFQPGAVYKLDQMQILGDLGRAKVALIGIGSSFQQVVEAQVALAQKGVKAAAVSPKTLNRFQASEWKKLSEACQGNFIFVEDHQKIGGASQYFISEMITNGIALKSAKVLAVDGEFGQSAYTALDLYRRHKIDAASIVEAALKI
jgi:transketolase